MKRWLLLTALCQSGRLKHRPRFSFILESALPTHYHFQHFGNNLNRRWQLNRIGIFGNRRAGAGVRSQNSAVAQRNDTAFFAAPPTPPPRFNGGLKITVLTVCAYPKIGDN